jgi:hypothetical protein
MQQIKVSLQSLFGILVFKDGNSILTVNFNQFALEMEAYSLLFDDVR